MSDIEPGDRKGTFDEKCAAAAKEAKERGDYDAPLIDDTTKKKSPMQKSHAVCLAASLSYAMLTILYASGMLLDLPTFLWIGTHEEPVGTLIVTMLIAVALSVAIEFALPDKIDNLARVPMVATFAYWLYVGWNAAIEGKLEIGSPSPITLDGAGAVVGGSVLIALCYSLHKKVGRETDRIEGFVWSVLFFNFAAFVIAVLLAIFSNHIKGEAVRHVDSFVERQRYISDVCPHVKSEDFCKALNVVLEDYVN